MVVFFHFAGARPWSRGRRRPPWGRLGWFALRASRALLPRWRPYLPFVVLAGYLLFSGPLLFPFPLLLPPASASRALRGGFEVLASLLAAFAPSLLPLSFPSVLSPVSYPRGSVVRVPSAMPGRCTHARAPLLFTRSCGTILRDTSSEVWGGIRRHEPRAPVAPPSPAPGPPLSSRVRFTILKAMRFNLQRQPRCDMRKPGWMLCFAVKNDAPTGAK